MGELPDENKWTVQLSLIRRHREGSLVFNVEHPVEHTYETRKAAREDYELLAKLFKRISAIPEMHMTERICPVVDPYRDKDKCKQYGGDSCRWNLDAIVDCTYVRGDDVATEEPSPDAG